MLYADDFASITGVSRLFDVLSDFFYQFSRATVRDLHGKNAWIILIQAIVLAAFQRYLAASRPKPKSSVIDHTLNNN